jgi:hypothetical protein
MILPECELSFELEQFGGSSSSYMEEDFSMPVSFLFNYCLKSGGREPTVDLKCQGKIEGDSLN